MPVTNAALSVGIAILVSVPIAVLLLNKRKPGLGWKFLAVVVILFLAGNLVERVVGK